MRQVYLPIRNIDNNDTTPPSNAHANRRPKQIQRKAALFAHLSAMLCSDFETWNTAHLLARMAGEGYGALLPPHPPPPPGGDPASPLPSSSSAVAPLAGGGVGGEGGWLVLRKHLLQWLLAVSARCGDVRASSEYFAGLAELTAALEEERGKADRESYHTVDGRD